MLKSIIEWSNTNCDNLWIIMWGSFLYRFVTGFMSTKHGHKVKSAKLPTFLVQFQWPHLWVYFKNNIEMWLKIMRQIQLYIKYRPRTFKMHTIMSLAVNYYNFDSAGLSSDCLTELEWSTSEVNMQTKLFQMTSCISLWKVIVQAILGMHCYSQWASNSGAVE